MMPGRSVFAHSVLSGWRAPTGIPRGRNGAAAMLSRRLSRALGGGRPGVAMTGSGTGQWRGAASWERGLHVVVVGTAPAYASSPETDAEPVTRPATAVAVSYVIGNGLDKSVSALIDQQEYPKVTPEALTEVARADSAIGWSGVSGLAPLRGLFASYLDSAQFDERTERPPAGKSAFAELLRAGWTTALACADGGDRTEAVIERTSNLEKLGSVRELASLLAQP